MKKNNSIGQFQVKVNVPFAVLLVILGLATVVMYIKYPDYRNILVFATSVLGGMTAVYAAFYIGQSLKIHLKRDAIRQSLDLIHVEDTIELNQVRMLIDEQLYQKEIPPSEMYNLISKDTTINNAVITVLNQFETLSVAIQKGFADEDTLLTNLGFRIPFYFKTLEPYIKELRKQLDDEDLFIETEKLSRAWNAKRYLCSGDAIFK